MSRKTLFWVVLVLYVAAVGVASRAMWKGRNQRTLPVLETAVIALPSLQQAEARYGREKAPAYLAAARNALVSEQRFRLKETIEGVGEVDESLSGTMLERLAEKGVAELTVWDTRQILMFGSEGLVLAESLKGPGGEILLPEGKGPDPDALFIFLKAHGLTLERVKEGAVRPGKVFVKGTGSIVGLNATMFMVGVNFLVLVALLYLILWQPVVRLLDERAEAIRANIDTAEEQRRKAEELLNQRNKEVREARDEREVLRKKGEQEGREERVRLVQEAQHEVARIRARAEEEIEAERTGARETLVEDIGRLSVALASSVLKREVSEEKHRELVDEFIRGLSREDK